MTRYKNGSLHYQPAFDAGLASKKDRFLHW